MKGLQVTFYQKIFSTMIRFHGKLFLFTVAVIWLLIIFSACNVEDEQLPVLPGTIEISGKWEDNFGGSHTITSIGWETDYQKYKIVNYDNESNVAITQNSSDDSYYPDKFNKVVWTEVQNNTFYSCTIDYGRDTEDEAASTEKTADEADLSNSGCGSNPWTLMTKAQ